MAKHIKMPKHQTGRSVTTKTPYGSTSDMIVESVAEFKDLQLNDGQVVLQDDDGYYITERNRVDSGRADPNRYANPTKRIKAG
jgi:hypothetical protein